jgi:hypothetical protein
MSNASIASRAARIFPARACMDGLPLFAADRVELTRVAPRAVEATVKSKRTRQVRIDVEGEDCLAVACTCSPEAIACKHLWATLLAASRAGALEALRAGVTPLRLSHLQEKKPTVTKAKNRGTHRSNKRNAKKT